MAQIVTITNPLTGQPAQVDQLDHTAQQIDDGIARALPGGAIDIALSNKAPAGYGLGGAAKYLTADDDLNNIWEAGWYCWDAPPVNCPVFGIEGYGYVTYSMMLVLNKGGNYVSGQVIYAPSGEVLQRMYNGSIGGWQPWEWVNPPMRVGVEYRTTERYQGKTVYTMLVDFGSFPNSTQKDVAIPEKGFSAYNVCIDFTKSVVTYPNAPRTSILPFKNGITEISVNNACVRVTTSSDLSSASGYICVKYTKSTD